MKIAHIKISNILGIEELEFDAGQFVEIAGRNGEGKTSVLEAVKTVMQGGHDATLVRKGAEKGEVVLVLDDGTTITKRINQRGADVSVKTADGMKASRPQEYIGKLTDLLSVNPVSFLRATKKERVAVMLEAMPLRADAARLKEITKVDVQAENVHALDVIAKLHTQVYDERTGTNRAVKEKESTINQLRATIPDLPAGTEQPPDDLRQKLAEIDAAHESEMHRIASKLSGFKVESDARITAHQSQIEELQNQIEKARAAITAEKDAFAEIERKASMQREKASNDTRTKRQPVEQALSVAEANIKSIAIAESTRANIARMEGEADQLRKDADTQTKALAGLEAYKEELLASLPIPGIEVRGGELYRDGIQFDRLNTAQQVQIAVQLAKLRAKDLGVVCVDGIELLDEETYGQFKKQAIESGLQLFVTRVANQNFSINND